MTHFHIPLNRAAENESKEPWNYRQIGEIDLVTSSSRGATTPSSKKHHVVAAVVHTVAIPLLFCPQLTSYGKKCWQKRNTVQRKVVRARYLQSCQTCALCGLSNRMYFICGVSFGGGAAKRCIFRFNGAQNMQPETALEILDWHLSVLLGCQNTRAAFFVLTLFHAAEEVKKGKSNLES